MAYLLFSQPMIYYLHREHENWSCPESAESILDPYKFPRLFHVRFNITSTFMSISNKGFFPSGFPTKILHVFLISSRVIHLSFIFLSMIFYYLSPRTAALCSFRQFILSFFFLPTKELTVM